MRKERKSEYENWTGDPFQEDAVSAGTVELEKLRQLEALKWTLEDLVDELREIRNQLSPRGIGQRVK